MKTWTLRFMAGAAVLFVTAAPVSVENAALVADTELLCGDGIVEGAVPATTATAADAVLPCEGSKFGCWPLKGGSCVIRWGANCEKMKRVKDQCNLDHPKCAGLPGGGGGQH